MTIFILLSSCEHVIVWETAATMALNSIVTLIYYLWIVIFSCVLRKAINFFCWAPQIFTNIEKLMRF